MRRASSPVKCHSNERSGLTRRNYYMFRIYLIVLLALILSSEAKSQMRTCDMYMDFQAASETQLWRAVNDGVMGGLSSGGPRFENGSMTFQGVINTNGGGFSSVRSPVQDGVLSTSSGIKLRLRSNGRDYKLTFRTNVVRWGRRISFQAPIPRTPIGEWAEVTVQYSDLRGTIFGRRVRGATFDRSAVTEIGIILADGRDGSFRLDVDWLKECAA